jgi:hypothetical protein
MARFAKKSALVSAVAPLASAAPALAAKRITQAAAGHAHRQLFSRRTATRATRSSRTAPRLEKGSAPNVQNAPALMSNCHLSSGKSKAFRYRAVASQRAQLCPASETSPRGALFTAARRAPILITSSARRVQAESSSRGGKRRGDPGVAGASDVPLDRVASLAMTVLCRLNAPFSSSRS